MSTKADIEHSISKNACHICKGMLDQNDECYQCNSSFNDLDEY